MKLSEKERKELRNNIKEILKNSPKDKKVTIGKEILEQLLFEEVVINEKENIILKLPVWSGEFLKQIDLSQIDFSNVSWGGMHYLSRNNNVLWQEDIDLYYNALKDNNLISKEVLDADIKNLKEKNVIDKDYFVEYVLSIVKDINIENKEEVIKRLKRISELYRFKNTVVDYSGTNANINLSDSFEYVNGNSIYVYNCIFKECNVYMSNKPKKLLLYNSDFSSSTINLPKVVNDEDIHECIFEGCNLSKTEFDATTMLNLGRNLNNLNNTGAKIIHKDFKLGYVNMFKERFLIGCYFNGDIVRANDSDEDENSKNKRV